MPQRVECDRPVDLADGEVNDLLLCEHGEGDAVGEVDPGVWGHGGEQFVIAGEGTHPHQGSVLCSQSRGLSSRG